MRTVTLAEGSMSFGVGVERAEWFMVVVARGPHSSPSFGPAPRGPLDRRYPAGALTMAIRPPCAANMQGTHVLVNSSGGPIWTVGGRHDYQLERTAEGWRIAGWTFTIQWATGNQNIVALAAARG
jgi:hypothetical protein